jgi:Skp family chaperone for outer membrane proteins
MSKTRIAFACALIAMFAVLATAQTAPVAKIGFVDSNRAVVSTDEGKAEYQKITDWLKKQDDEMQGLRKQLDDKQTQFRNQQNILAEDKKEELLKDIDRLDTEIKRRTEDIKKDYARRVDEFGKKMDKKITPLFNKFAQDNGYTLILYINPQVIAYFNETADVTDQIIKLYNQAYPFQAPAAPAK